MGEHLERTPVAQQGFDRRTGEVPIVVCNDVHYDMFTRLGQDPVDDDSAPSLNGAAMDPFEDDTPLECPVDPDGPCEVCD